uniref:Phospholipase A2 n=1 Tax=Ascaris lumbricoides TaxID=6252 RepID=A0A0M3HFT7_ASCLU
MKLLFSIVFVMNLQYAIMEYYCGPKGNIFVQILSKWFTNLCQQDEINKCCYYHDVCYDNCAVTQQACDAYFCDCLQRITPSSFFCRNIVQAGHCNFAQFFGSPYKCPSYMGRPQTDFLPYAPYRDHSIRPNIKPRS